MEYIKRYPYMGEEELEFYFKTEMVNIEISEVCKYEKIKREDIKTYFVKYGNLYLFLNNGKKVEIETSVRYFDYKYLSYLMENNIIIGEH